MASASTSKELKYAQEFVDFVNASPTPYHAVNSVKSLLSEAGFEEIHERTNWFKSHTLQKVVNILSPETDPQ